MYTFGELADVLNNRDVLHTENCNCKKIKQSLLEYHSKELMNSAMDYYMNTYTIENEQKRYYACDLYGIYEFRTKDVLFMVEQNDKKYSNFIVSYFNHYELYYNIKVIESIYNMSFDIASDIVKKIATKINLEYFNTEQWLNFFVDNNMPINHRLMKVAFQNKYDKIIEYCLDNNNSRTKDNKYYSYSYAFEYYPEYILKLMDKHNIEPSRYSLGKFDEKTFEYAIKKYPTIILKNYKFENACNTQKKLDIYIENRETNEKFYLHVFKYLSSKFFSHLLNKYIESGYDIIKAKKYIMHCGDTEDFKKLLKVCKNFTRDEFHAICESTKIDPNLAIENGYVVDEYDIIYMLENNVMLNDYKKYIDEYTYSKLWIIAKDSPIDIKNDLTEHGHIYKHATLKGFEKFMKNNGIVPTQNILEIVCADEKTRNRCGKVSYLMERGLVPSKLALLLCTRGYSNQIKTMKKMFYNLKNI